MQRKDRKARTVARAVASVMLLLTLSVSLSCGGLGVLVAQSERPFFFGTSEFAIEIGAPSDYTSMRIRNSYGIDYITIDLGIQNCRGGTPGTPGTRRFVTLMSWGSVPGQGAWARLYKCNN
jgi:hypothetical protein